MFFFAQCQEIKQPPKDISYKELLNEAYATMDSALEIRKAELINYLNIIHTEATQTKSDKLLINFFRTQLVFNKIKDVNQLPQQTKEKSQQLQQAVTEHFIAKYRRFYDMLMIDKSGKIFHTIRKEADLGLNIFQNTNKTHYLSKHLKEQNGSSFVDFTFYDVSNEPSAFFIEPIKHNEEFLGWIVMQFSLSKINHLFSLHRELGNTGELIMVNKNHYMLTDSRFQASSTMLNQKLPEQNIDEKFAEGKGHKKVTDYRGFNVISSFDTLSFQKNKWLLIAKMNESEIITNFFKRNHAKLDKFISILDNRKIEKAEETSPKPNHILVNIDELKRTENTPIYTFGISECTGIVAFLPEKFVYMAHISPYDNIYGKSNTDIIGQMLNKIRFLEIPKSQQQLMRFIVVAPHKNTAFAATQKIINAGYFLNQVKIAHNASARYANIFHHPSNNETIIEWFNEQSLYENSKHIESLDEQLCKSCKYLN